MARKTGDRLSFGCGVIGLLIVQYLSTQITIQKTDIQKGFAPHATIMLYSDTSTLVNVGKTGGPNVVRFFLNVVSQLIVEHNLPSVGDSVPRRTLRPFELGLEQLVATSSWESDIFLWNN
jgi:hypothetical protein